MQKPSVIITGASRGIGRAIALKYAQSGYRVAISCIHNTEQLQDVRTQIEALGVDCLTFQGDMGDYSQTAQFIDRSVRTFGIPNVLINNAGRSYVGLLQDMSCEDWDSLLRTNLTSVFHCCKLILPHMIAQKKGKILNISSVWGEAGASMETAYSATKGGINAFTRALAKELAPSNIQVNALACGIIDTDMNAFLSQEERDAITQDIPSGRMGTPEEVAEMALSITEGPSYLTGQIITLDGGWM